ncbi:UDP-4-amino-4,6-dideoxy-N-acetyl-beta-L-altrosamine transaminase [Polynucleobacter sp. AM-7D1]|nr:UDP-4-amino-4,6-dideoxy-N-acetyl-beta-L-altrosamine transaminase [Polynucleobacter sp. AM-7D1]
MIPYARQDVNDQDVSAVIEVLRSDYLTQGPLVERFENSVKSFCHAKAAIAVNSATSALHISCLAMGVKSGDIVWTSPISFVASSNCALYCGASVDFIDIDPLTYNISAMALEEKLISSALQNKLPKVVIAVHFSGQPCDMETIFSLSQKYGFKIIEDASHAIGAQYKNLAVGSGQYSDITIFSFHPVKIITSGEGGMILTNNLELSKKCQLLRSHGIESISGELNLHPSKEIWNYQQIDLGFNYRMTDIQAALGLSQMTRLSDFIAKRRTLAARYDILLANFPITTPWQHPDGLSAYHLYVIRLHTDKLKKGQHQIYDELRDLGILVNLHYIPIYLHPYYVKMGFKRGYCPEAEQYFSQALSLPLFSGLNAEDQELVVASLKQVLQ